MSIELYLAGAWITTVFVFACYVAFGEITKPTGAVGNFVIIGIISSLWPLVWAWWLALLVRKTIDRLMGA